MIKNFDAVKEEAPYLSEIQKAINHVQESGRYILGPEVQSFEKEVAEYCETRFAVGVASCTDALRLSLQALGIEKGDKVIAPAYSSIATITGMINLGIKPVLCDIEPDTFNIDPNDIRKKITKNTKGIILVHLFGHSANLPVIKSISIKYGLKIIEDCAQSFGTKYMNKSVGSFGIGCFSFFPTKNLGAQGDGGMITTNDEEIYKKLRSLRFLGRNPDAKNRKSKEHAEMIGTNSRLDEIQAAILRVKLKYFDRCLAVKIQNAKYYIELLKSLAEKKYIILPSEKDYTSHSWHKFIIRIQNRNEIAVKMKEMGVETSPMYDTPMHLHQATEFLGYKKGDFPEAEKAAEEILALPFYTEIPLDEIKEVVRVLEKVFS